MRKRISTVICIMVVSVALVGSALQASVIFKDSFSVSKESSDLNFESDSPSRQTGCAGLITYKCSANYNAATKGYLILGTSKAPGKLFVHAERLIDPVTWFSPGHDFTESSSIAISADVVPEFAGGENPATNYERAGFVFGADKTGSWLTWPASGAAFMVKRGGGWEFAAAGGAEHRQGNVAAKSGNTPYNIRIEIKQADWSGKGPATVIGKIDGVEVVKVTLNKGFTHNFITFTGTANQGAKSADYTFANFTIESL